MEFVVHRRSTSFKPGDHIDRNNSAIPNVAGVRCAYVQEVVGAFARGFGFLTSDFGVGKSQELGC